MNKSGERYKSKKQEMKHERSEGKKERMMEYGGKMENNGCTKRKCCK
jgi:hypothetical protein